MSFTLCLKQTLDLACVHVVEVFGDRDLASHKAEAVNLRTSERILRHHFGGEFTSTRKDEKFAFAALIDEL